MVDKLELTHPLQVNGYAGPAKHIYRRPAAASSEDIYGRNEGNAHKQGLYFVQATCKVGSDELPIPDRIMLIHKYLVVQIAVREGTQV